MELEREMEGDGVGAGWVAVGGVGGEAQKGAQEGAGKGAGDGSGCGSCSLYSESRS